MLPELVSTLESCLAEQYVLSTPAQHAFNHVEQGGVSPYGVLILAKPALQPVFCVTELPTLMDRTLLTAKLRPYPGAADSECMVVGSVHLESLDSARTRRKQLDVAAKVLGE